MISRITLQNVLPEVFGDLRETPRVSSSQIWLRDVTFDKGTDYLIYAESGTGKSSLCSFIYGARRDYSGRILFDDRDVSRFSPNDWSACRRDSLAYLPQQLSLFPELTVIENIEIKNRLTRFKSLDEILAMLDEMEIIDKADKPARLLSIGQQQRVAIIRALCQPFDFLLLDEPVSHLDARNNARVAAMITSQARKQGASLIVTSVGNHLQGSQFKELKL